MIKKIINVLKQINKIGYLEKKINCQLILSAYILSKYNLDNIDKIISNIQLAEFKVFSQWGDDGIIDFLVNYLDIENKIFIEFGVSDYEEANTRFLLIKNNWEGLVIDSSKANIDKIIKDEIYWKYNLNAQCHFITKNNINDIIKNSGISGEIGLLHIDIDGNDYWIWKEISVISPVIAIIEYNSIFELNPWTIPYIENFERTKFHYSNLYCGASLVLYVI
ncbi:MAG: hypothetical protein KatS3mg068_0111 [Candidatus Sericytochromatia bacterium]|nr:MAG: hypothetical protein KatS3mg068_0111 [Candidatus Sericytochromatia bacterium]